MVLSTPGIFVDAVATHIKIGADVKAAAEARVRAKQRIDVLEAEVAKAIGELREGENYIGAWYFLGVEDCVAQTVI